MKAPLERFDRASGGLRSCKIMNRVKQGRGIFTTWIRPQVPPELKVPVSSCTSESLVETMMGPIPRYCSNSLSVFRFLLLPYGQPWAHRDDKSDRRQAVT